MEREAGQAAPGQGIADDIELLLRNVRLECELDSLEALLDAERRRSEELQEDRDRWHVQAERFVLSPPSMSVPGPPVSQLVQASGRSPGLSRMVRSLSRR